MKLKRFVVIDWATKKIVARYLKRQYADAMHHELSKQQTLFKSRVVEKGAEVWESGKLIEKSYEDDITTGKYFLSPKPLFINNKISKEILEKERA